MIIYDLEMASWPGAVWRNWSGEGEFPEIIQIGAVRVGPGAEPLDEFNVYVRRQITGPLSDYITDLTGIDDETLEREGVPFDEALQRFADFSGSDAPVCAFGADHVSFNKNCAWHGLEHPFEHRFRDIRNALCKLLGRDPKTTMSCELYAGEGSSPYRAHDALGDCLTILSAVREHNLYDRLKATL